MKLFVSLVVMLYIVFLLWAIWRIYSLILSRKIMREGRNKKSFTYNFLSTRFSRRNTVRALKLLIKNPSGRKGKYLADIGLVFVNKGGIMVIDTVPGAGFIDVTPGGEWNRLLDGKYYTFEDPFLKNKRSVDAVKTFLRSEGVENVPVHSVVLFSGRNVKFSKKINGLITAKDLVPFLKDMNKDKFLTSREIRSVVKLLREKNA